MFKYGSFCLWVDIESVELQQNDKRGFEDLAYNGVKIALDNIPQIERNLVAHDFLIARLNNNALWDNKMDIVYRVDLLTNAL